ncbi:NAD-dependent epimerase/dehydratase family protein [Chryseobacterium herbae]|uniref:GDP-mannose 4,6-dehydratase n=1 Tax=Chryseobacterium herbae TaxID=2976476 RepID=A0ABT2J0S8_9FLAO|nr:NAD-dependent epimerase/dehydratase family protein [Chryseobacterium sp. pc1-10]MCT2564649.1 GDP-mannose 4,6-dehydratase [Chryseobacterium sp. pc1-10]
MSVLLNEKKVIVTGGLGFIGHNLVKALIDRFNCNVVVIDNCSNSNPTVLNEYKDRFLFLQADVLNVEDYSDHIIDSDYIFHLACSHISASTQNPEHDLNVNALSTLRILNYLKQNNSEKLVRFITASSSSVYGNMGNHDSPFDESAPPDILNNYAATKLLSEHYALLYSTKNNIPVTILRYSNVYGYGQSFDNRFCGVLGMFIHNGLKGVNLKIIGDGEQTRDYTFVDDAVNATILASTSDNALNEVFNVGTGRETSINKIVSIIKNLIPDTETEKLSKRDIDNITRRCISYEKAKQKLNWEPAVDVENGIELTINWYKNYLNTAN